LRVCVRPVAGINVESERTRPDIRRRNVTIVDSIKVDGQRYLSAGGARKQGYPRKSGQGGDVKRRGKETINKEGDAA
jgi:hypothetical protein